MTPLKEKTPPHGTGNFPDVVSTIVAAILYSFFISCTLIHMDFVMFDNKNFKSVTGLAKLRLSSKISRDNK